MSWNRAAFPDAGTGELLRVVSASPAFKARVECVIGEVLRRPRDAELIAGDVVEMRAAICPTSDINDFEAVGASSILRRTT